MTLIELGTLLLVKLERFNMKKIWAAIFMPLAVLTLIPYAIVIAIMYLSINEGVKVIKEQF